MRVLTITALYPPFHRGGYGLLSHRVCEGIREAGAHVGVLSGSPACFEGEDSPVKVGEEVERSLHVSADTRPHRLLRHRSHNLRMVEKAIRRTQPDVIYFHSGDGLCLDVFNFAASRGIPTAVLLGDTWLAQAWRRPERFDAWTGLTLNRPEEPLVKRLVRTGLRAAGRKGMPFQWNGHPSPAHVQAISTFLLDDLQSAGAVQPSPPVLVPVPLPQPFITAEGRAVGNLRRPGRALRALFLSRLELGKGPDVAIRAMAYAVSKGADVTLTLAGLRGHTSPGSRPLEEDLKQLAEECGVPDRVHWASAKDTGSLLELYRSHDVFLFPSRIVEGFGMVNAEAMACGLPVIGVAQGGAADIIQDEISGMGVEVDNHQSMGTHLARLAADPAWRQKLSEGAERVAERHATSSVIPLILRHLESVAATR